MLPCSACMCARCSLQPDCQQRRNSYIKQVLLCATPGVSRQRQSEDSSICQFQNKSSLTGNIHHQNAKLCTRTFLDFPQKVHHNVRNLSPRRHACLSLVERSSAQYGYLWTNAFRIRVCRVPSKLPCIERSGQ